MVGFLTVARKEAFVNVTLRGIRFIPDRFTVLPNAMVHVRIVQEDTVPHTFTLVSEKDRNLPGTWSPAELDAYLAANTFTDAPVPDVVGTVVWANFTAPSAQGVYEFLCRIPGHFQGGMIGFMTVSEAPATGGPRLQIDLIQGIMLATIAFVLLFAAAYHVRAVRAQRRSR
jgi:uncharacterized cupredoxin-like copper-binding protein